MSMDYIKISSKGLLNERFFTLLGGSTKRDKEGKIGFFGSGLKYSLAYLLRNKYDFKVFIGLNEIKFSTIQETVDEKDFEVICINGRKSDITTDFGPKWVAWMIVREFYSNAIDEGDEEISLTSTVKADPERTTIYIKNEDDFIDVSSNFDTYFSFNRKVVNIITQPLGYRCRDGVDHAIPNVKILTKSKSEDQSVKIYRKGILIHTGYQKSLYDYDISLADINEERLALDQYDLVCDCMTALLNTKTALNIPYKQIGERVFEDIKISQGMFFADQLALEHFVEDIGSKTIAPIEAYDFFHEQQNLYWLPIKLLTILKEKYGVFSVLETDKDKLSKDPTKEELENFNHDNLLDAINYIKSFIKDLELPEFNYQIKMKVFRDKGTVGTVNRVNNVYEIYISIELHSVIEMVDTILEEYFHIISEDGDKTLAFQNFIMRTFAHLIIRKY